MLRVTKASLSACPTCRVPPAISHTARRPYPTQRRKSCWPNPDQPRPTGSPWAPCCARARQTARIAAFASGTNATNAKHCWLLAAALQLLASLYSNSAVSWIRPAELHLNAKALSVSASACCFLSASLLCRRSPCPSFYRPLLVCPRVPLAGSIARQVALRAERTA